MRKAGRLRSSGHFFMKVLIHICFLQCCGNFPKKKTAQKDRWTATPPWWTARPTTTSTCCIRYLCLASVAAAAIPRSIIIAMWKLSSGITGSQGGLLAMASGSHPVPWTPWPAGRQNSADKAPMCCAALLPMTEISKIHFIRPRRILCWKPVRRNLRLIGLVIMSSAPSEMEVLLIMHRYPTPNLQSLLKLRFRTPFIKVLQRVLIGWPKRHSTLCSIYDL